MQEFYDCPASTGSYCLASELTGALWRRRPLYFSNRLEVSLRRATSSYEIILPSWIYLGDVSDIAKKININQCE